MYPIMELSDYIPRLGIQYESYYFPNDYDSVFSVGSIILFLFR